MPHLILECWNPRRNRYEPRGEYSEHYGPIMFDKPYFRRCTRRLIRVETTILKQARGEASR